MKQYNYKIECGDAVMNGVKVSAKAESDEAARVKILESMKKATRELDVTGLQLLGTGKLTPAQMLGAAGGKKSRRSISPEHQKKMQEGRAKKSQPNVIDNGLRGSAQSTD